MILQCCFPSFCWLTTLLSFPLFRKPDQNMKSLLVIRLFNLIKSKRVGHYVHLLCKIDHFSIHDDDFGLQIHDWDAECGSERVPHLFLVIFNG